MDIVFLLCILHEKGKEFLKIDNIRFSVSNNCTLLEVFNTNSVLYTFTKFGCMENIFITIELLFFASDVFPKHSRIKTRMLLFVTTLEL